MFISFVVETINIMNLKSLAFDLYWYYIYLEHDNLLGAAISSFSLSTLKDL